MSDKWDEEVDRVLGPLLHDELYSATLKAAAKLLRERDAAVVQGLELAKGLMCEILDNAIAAEIARRKATPEGQ